MDGSAEDSQLPVFLGHLTPVDSFLWGYVKNLVFYVKNTDIQHSKVRVRDAVITITHNMLQT